MGRGGRPERDADEETIVCRCEDITLRQVRELILERNCTVEEAKRLLRIGMGPCQGRTCGSILQQEVARLTKTPIDQVLPPRFRPPSRSIRLGVIASAAEADER